MILRICVVFSTGNVYILLLRRMNDSIQFDDSNHWYGVITALFPVFRTFHLRVIELLKAAAASKLKQFRCETHPPPRNVQNAPHWRNAKGC